MVSLRSGKGIGDAIYLAAIARHLVERGEHVEVATGWPDVFRPLRGRVVISPFRRDHIDRIAHYIDRKRIAGTDQFQDCCLRAGLDEPVDFRLEWTPTNRRLVDQVRSSGKPVVIVQMLREPMGRTDGFGMDLLPRGQAVQRAIDAIRGRAFVVLIGKGESLFPLSGIDLDLSNRTTVSELIDVAWAADAALGYCSFIAPLAEALRKPLLLVWSRKGSRSSNDFIRAIKPAKILHRATNGWAWDDCGAREMEEAVNALLEQVRVPADV